MLITLQLFVNRRFVRYSQFFQLREYMQPFRIDNMEQRIKLLALFIISIALIAFELSIVRVFAVGNWSNFGNLIISTALLGFGLAGAILTFLSRSIEKHGQAWLYWSSLAFLVSMPLAQILAQKVPFEVIFLSGDPSQLWWIALYYVIYGFPFIAAATFIGTCFVVLRNQVRQLYFWNMAGSGLGGFVIIISMYFLAPQNLVLPSMILVLIANLMVGMQSMSSGKLSISNLRFLTSVLTAGLAIFALFSFGQIRISEFKSISYARKYPELFLRHHSQSPAGEFHVFQSSYFHFAPGLSDNASLLKGAFPKQPFWALYVDGSGPIGIMGKLDQESAKYVDFLPMAAPYETKQAPKVLLVHLGGGINAQVARYKGSSEVVICEQNPELVKLLRDDPQVSLFTGDLLKDPRIKLEDAEARAWARDNKNSFDIIEISLIDSIGLSDSGGYAISENYTYTKQAMQDYLSGLNQDGILSITVWNNLSPPRNVLKLLNTIVAALKDSGVKNPEQNLFMFDQLRSTATILVKKNAFKASELNVLRGFVKRNSFNLIHYPGIPALEIDLFKVVAGYRKLLVNNASAPMVQVPNNDAEQAAASQAPVTPSELYQLTIAELVKNGGQGLEDAYLFDIRPIDDNRPYYAGYLKLGHLGEYLGDLNQVSEEWGYLLLIGILIQAIIFGLLVILIPVIGKWKQLFSQKKGTMGIILYYASLGLSYMLVEIYLIQRLVGFLGNPIISMSIVITAMLIISGIGNLLSPKLGVDRSKRVRIAVVGIVLTLVFYMFLLGPIIDGLQNVSLVLRIFFAVLLIAPSAFFMGVPYPNGLDALGSKRPALLPWAWGMNGGLSVAGSALAWLVSVSAGFIVLLSIAIGLYVIVAIVFPVNEIEGS